AGSIARQTTELVLHAGALLAYADTFAFGRLAHSERFSFERFESGLRIATPDGVTRFARRSVLTPRTQRVGIEGAVGDAGVLGSLLLLGESDRPALEEVEGTYAGVSMLPHGIGWSVQVLASRPEQAE